MEFDSVIKFCKEYGLTKSYITKVLNGSKVKYRNWTNPKYKYEKWVDINSFPQYEVSSYGRIRTRILKVIAKPYKTKSGIWCARLQLNGTLKFPPLQTIVCKSFNIKATRGIVNLNEDLSDCSLGNMMRVEDYNADIRFHKGKPL